MIIAADNLTQLRFNESGLLPVVAQNIDTGEVLMVAWMNAEALQQTLARRRAVFWSRSRQKLWEKGEQSGNTLELIDMHTDCDRDTLLLLVRPRGPACHEGTLTCFADRPLTRRPLEFLGELEAIIAKRLSDPNPAASYTAKLAAAGSLRIAQKVGEEGLEVALAAAAGTRESLISESADLLFHLVLLLRQQGGSLQDVVDELQQRHTQRTSAAG